MARIVRTARGDMVDFDSIIIKQQLAQAPMNMEVARRKEFIDAKEGSSRAPKIPSNNQEDIIDQPTVIVTPINAPSKVKETK
jgi:hypothetical protein